MAKSPPPPRAHHPYHRLPDELASDFCTEYNSLRFWKIIRKAINIRNNLFFNNHIGIVNGNHF